MSTPLPRRDFIRSCTIGTVSAAVSPRLRSQGIRPGPRVFDVRDYGAKGDGIAYDTQPIQRAIDEATASGSRAQVLMRGGRRYLVGPLELRGPIDFHLADDAELLVSSRASDYPGGIAAITANNVQGLRLSGTGRINGRSPGFMTHFDAENEWWRPATFRPRLVVLTGCKDLEVRDLTFYQAPSWTLHLMGCEKVLVDRVKIRNQLDVPNCDGIDPDHCRDVEIRNCDIQCGDDAIVIKTTRAGLKHGESSNIQVKDCVLETQDSGLKIGTETVSDIRNIRFERCQIKTSCRGLCIQLRDEGNVSGIVFRDITFESRYFSAPWWGRGEAISFTAIPRTPDSKLGRLHDIRVENVTGRAENSVRLSGSVASRLRDIWLKNVAVSLSRWTKYPGRVWDNRPTTAMVDLEPHDTPAIAVRHADRVELDNCRVTWGPNCPASFTHALEAEDVTDLSYPRFSGEAAQPGKVAAISIR